MAGSQGSPGSPYLTGVPLARVPCRDSQGGPDRYGALATSRDRRRERRRRACRRVQGPVTLACAGSRTACPLPRLFAPGESCGFSRAFRGWLTALREENSNISTDLPVNYMARQTRMRSFRDSRFRPRNRDTQKDRFPWTLPAAPGTRNSRRAVRRGARRRPRCWGFPGSWSPR